MRLRKYLTLIIMVGVLLLMATPDVQAAKTLKIGLIMPLTGQLSLEGGHEANGVKVAVDEINAKGGMKVGGETYKIELLVYDDGGVPKESIAAMEKLATRDNVKMVIGAFTSSSTFAMMPIAAREKVIIITPNASAAKLTQVGNKWFFRGGGNVPYCVEMVVNYVKELGFKTVAGLAVNDDYGRDASSKYRAGLEKLGIKVITQEYFDHGTTDFYSVLTKIKGSKPEAILGVMEAKACSIFIRQAREICPEIAYVDGGAADANQLVKLAGAAADGAFIFSNGPPLNHESVADFVKRYRERFKMDPMPFSFGGYDTVMVLVDSMQRAGTVTDSEKIQEAMTKSTLEGLMGTHNFDSNNESSFCYWGVGKIEGGKPKYWKPNKK